MVFSRIKSRVHPSTPDCWDSKRAGQLHARQSAQASELSLLEQIKRQHRLSLVCFLEQIDPAILSLAPELLTRVQSELEFLGQLEPLTAYAVVLERLSSDMDASSSRLETADAAA
jgi:hypothetical protein